MYNTLTEVSPVCDEECRKAFAMLLGSLSKNRGFYGDCTNFLAVSGQRCCITVVTILMINVQNVVPPTFYNSKG